MGLSRSMRAVRNKLRHARELSALERRTLVRASLLLWVVDLGLRTIGFARVDALLGRHRGGRVGAVGASDPTRSRIEEIVRGVDLAARLQPLRRKCLRRALVLQHLLREHGVATEIRFGVRRTQAGGEGIEAHAWLERDGIPVGEPAGDGTFSTLKSVSTDRGMVAL